jgi:hypothetical protein
MQPVHTFGSKTEVTWPDKHVGFPLKIRVAFAKGEVRAEQGDGKYVERPTFSPIHVANSTWKQATAPKAVSRADVTP